MSELKVIAGLGNPGPQYARTRHNAGFMAVDLLSDGVSGEEGSFRVTGNWKEKFGAEICEGSLDGQKVILAKPQKYMNLSGGPVQQLLSFYKCSPQDLVVVHDDIDLPFSSLRLRQGGGDGGHNGLKSIASCIGSKDFFRVRFGVGRPSGITGPGNTQPVPGNADADGKQQAVSDWVLSPFSKEEEKLLKGLLDKSCRAIFSLIIKGLPEAQRLYNG